MNTFDVICQSAIAVFGLASIFLIAKGNRWGFVAGLIQQPFWFFTTAYHHQWGIFFLNFGYLASWCLGVYNQFFKKKK